MIFSLFRNGKEVNNSDYFRVETEEILFTYVELEIWARFIQRHTSYGGIVRDGRNFINEAKSMGFSVEPVIT